MRIVLTLSLLLLLIPLPALAEQAPAAVGRVIALQGEVTASNSGRTRALAIRGTVGLGDEIVTGAAGRAQIMFIDHTTFAIGSNARFKVSEYHFDQQVRAQFEMLRGQFRMVSGQIAERNPQGFNLRTPTASIGIRGTMTAHDVAPEGEQHYSLDLDGDHTVEIITGQGRQTLNGDNLVVGITPDGHIGTPQPATLEQLDALDAATAVDQPLADAGGDGDNSDNSGEEGGDAAGQEPDGDGTNAGGEGEAAAGGDEYGADNTDGGGDEGGGDYFTADEGGDAGGEEPSFSDAWDADYSGDEPGSEFVADIQADLLTDDIIPDELVEPSDYTHGYLAAGVSIYYPSSPGPGFVPAAYYYSPLGSSLADDAGYPAAYTGGNASNPWLSFSSNPDGTQGAIESISFYDGGGNLLTWSGPAQSGTYVYDGEYTCPVTGEPHLEWGYWELDAPSFIFTVTDGVTSADLQLTKVFQVLGEQTDLAELNTLRTTSYVGNYTGGASGMYYEGTGAGTYLSGGSFSCQVDFSGNAVNNAFIEFPGDGIYLSGGNGTLQGNGEFQLSFPTVTLPAGTGSGDGVGSLFGPDGLDIGGTWGASASNAHAVGEFHGQDTGGGI